MWQYLVAQLVFASEEGRSTFCQKSYYLAHSPISLLIDRNLQHKTEHIHAFLYCSFVWKKTLLKTVYCLSLCCTHFHKNSYFYWCEIWSKRGNFPFACTDWHRSTLSLRAILMHVKLGPKNAAIWYLDLNISSIPHFLLLYFLETDWKQPLSLS